MNIERYFDVIYYSLCALIVAALLYTTQKGVRLQRKLASSADKKYALGTALAAVGTLIALVGGLVADNFLRSNTYFQQARFIFYYGGSSLIVYAITSIIGTLPSEAVPFKLSRGRFTWIIWGIFAATLAIASFYLFNPATFVLNARGDQIQLPVYWLPLLTATLLGAAVLPVALSKINDKAARARTLLVCLFAGLLFVGLLREAQIMPDLGDPLANLLIAFIPFTIGSFCLALSYNFSTTK